MNFSIFIPNSNKITYDESKNHLFNTTFCILFLFWLIGVELQAQNVGINSTGANPNASALLDIDATGGPSVGLLIPRIALTGINVAAPVTSPATSLLIYNTATANTGTNTVSPGYYYWNGAKWERFVTTTACGTGPFKLGKDTLGGIVFEIYIGSDCQQHGLIVSKTESTAVWQASGVLVNANRLWDGAFNTPLITSSAAATYIASLGAGWYLPSIDELNLLWKNSFYANKALDSGGFTVLSTTGVYWSSTEFNAASAYVFNFTGAQFSNNKNLTQLVRGVKAF